MLRLDIFLLLVSFSMISYGQTGNYTERVVEEIQLKLVIEREREGTIQKLKLYSNTNGDLIKEYELDKSSELFYPDKYYLGERKFIIVAGRYRFYILNLTNNRLIGPLSHAYRGESQDAISGNLGDFQIIDNGQYVLYGVADFGVFCLNLKDLYNPKDVACIYDTTRLSGNYMFIDHRYDNLFNIILANYIINQPNIFDREIEPKMLFKGLELEPNDNSTLYRIKDGEYVILDRANNRTKNDLIINFKTGEVYKRESLNEIKKQLEIK